MHGQALGFSVSEKCTVWKEQPVPFLPQSLDGGGGYESYWPKNKQWCYLLPWDLGEIVHSFIHSLTHETFIGSCFVPVLNTGSLSKLTLNHNVYGFPWYMHVSLLRCEYLLGRLQNFTHFYIFHIVHNVSLLKESNQKSVIELRRNVFVHHSFYYALNNIGTKVDIWSQLFIWLFNIFHISR